MPDAAISVDTLYKVAAREDVCEAMVAFYESANKEIASRRAQCINRGVCCRFGEFGHRLYVTTLEVAYFLAGYPSPLPVTQDACPHAIDGKCHARDFRPLGCRIFFCDPQAQDWQGPMTEALLALLRAMHIRLDVPYAYQDWLTVLRQLDDDGGPQDGADGIRLTIVD